MMPLPPRALWRVTGADRVRYLNGQTTQDVSRIAPGAAAYGAVLTGKGKIVGDLFLAVAAADGALHLDAALSLRDSLRDRLEQFLIADDAAIEDVTGAFALAHVTGDAAPVPPEGGLVFRNARFGVPGFDVWLPQPAASTPAAGPIDDALLARLEIEHGIARWGVEIDAETLPQEIALEEGNRGLSYEKGCYVGQETVARIRSLGHVNRRLVRLEQTAGPADLVPAPLLTSDGEEAGRLTRLAPFPDGTTRALGFLKRKFLETPPELRAGERRFRVLA